MKEHGQKNRVGAGFQAIVFLLTFSFLSAFFAMRYNLFIARDPYPLLLQNQETDKKITVGFHVAHFGKFDIPQNTFTLDGTLWFAFNPKDVSLNKIKKFSLFNGVLNHVSDPVVIEHDDINIAQFRIRATFHTALNYRMFPLDDHRINLMIVNNYLPQNMSFSSANKDIVLSGSLYIPGWNIMGKEVKTGFREVVLEKDNKRYADMHQEIIITFQCARTDPSLIINILLTLLLMLFISVLTFSSDEDSVLIVTVGIVALIGYRTVMQSMAPPQVGYFMFSDYMYLLTLLCVILTLFFGIMTREQDHSIFIKKLSIGLIYSLFAGSCALISVLL